MHFDPQGRLMILYYGIRQRGNKDGTLVRLENAGLDNDAQPIASLIRKDRLPQGLDATNQGLSLMLKSDCMTCHQWTSPSVGPAFTAIADRYRLEPETGKLVQKIILGGSGVWGDVPMPPHPNLGKKRVQHMLDTILQLP